jgi:hypothetical protein
MSSLAEITTPELIANHGDMTAELGLRASRTPIATTPKKRGPKNQAPTSGPLLNLRLFVFNYMQEGGLTQEDIAAELGGLSRPVISHFIRKGDTSAAVNQCFYFWAKEHGYTGDNQ